jgi:hypothetical protein
MKSQAEMEAEFKAGIANERANSQAAAKVFERVCRDGDHENLYDAAQLVHETVDGWRLAMKRVAKLGRVSPEIRDAFIPVWVESKHLPLSVGHRPTAAAALRVLMEGDYRGPDLRVYRGTSTTERRRRLYGFSWTVDLEIARTFTERFAKFAEHFAQTTSVRPLILSTVGAGERNPPPARPGRLFRRRRSRRRPVPPRRGNGHSVTCRAPDSTPSPAGA